MGSERDFWRRQGRWTALRQNAGWWLARFLPAALAISVLFACVLLLARHSGWSADAGWIAYLVLVAAAAGVAYRQAMPRFLPLAAGMTHLDARLRLNNRLTSANEGVGAYPAPQPVDDGLRWRWPRVLAFVIGSAALVTTAALVPLPAAGTARIALEQPPAWTETAAWIEEVSESDVVEKEAAEKLREQLNELSGQPQDEWYGQSSLEAGDALREQTAQSIEALQRNLQTASSALADAEALRENASTGDQKALGQRLSAATEGLQMGNLPLNRELLGKLKNVDLSKVRQLNPRQLKELRERLGKGEKACAACIGVGQGEKMVAGNDEPGGAGVTRGPGSPPLGRRPLPTDLHTESTEGLASADLSRALPGEVMGLERSEPPPVPGAPASGGPAGAISSAGSGGKAAWRNDLTPEEREVLERFFK